VVPLDGERVALRPLEEGDVPGLTRILREPEIAVWWGKYDAGRVRAELLDDPDTTAFAVELNGLMIGVATYSEEIDPDYRHAGLDISLTASCLGQGLGSEALRVLARHLIVERDHHRLTIDPAADNARAIRAYEKVGFRPVGIMRSYERVADGTWRDGLLMELLADDLR
jgi:aminoglycoside 6'-N-acetyltransferase